MFPSSKPSLCLCSAFQRSVNIHPDQKLGRKSHLPLNPLPPTSIYSLILLSYDLWNNIYFSPFPLPPFRHKPNPLLPSLLQLPPNRSFCLQGYCSLVSSSMIRLPYVTWTVSLSPDIMLFAHSILFNDRGLNSFNKLLGPFKDGASVLRSRPLSHAFSAHPGLMYTPSPHCTHLL